MKTFLIKKGVARAIVAVYLLILPMSKAYATEAVWHCSRLQEAVIGGGKLASDDIFHLASSGTNQDSIGITLVDLLDVYSNKPVQINGRAITACFMPGETPLSVTALKSLGLNAASMQQMSRHSAIVQGHFHPVATEGEMESCIRRRYPAVGYLSKVTENEWLTPCF
jgi:hypothetical protein